MTHSLFTAKRSSSRSVVWSISGPSVLKLKCTLCFLNAAMVALGRPALGIDLFIGEPELIGRGHGPALIRAFLRDVAFPRYGVDLCVIGPTRSNAGAIRAYEKAGFRFLKNYLEPDSREREHYLMELTRAELDAGEL